MTRRMFVTLALACLPLSVRAQTRVRPVGLYPAYAGYLWAQHRQGRISAGEIETIRKYGAVYRRRR